MVSSTSAAAQATAENEKRRKQTMERAKAVHLSRQLQMRLQYARLKVEYGWQKQNLNEVENLYFHHSHVRGPKPFPAPSIIAPPQHVTSFVGPSTNSVQSSLSFKLATSSLGRNSTNASSLQSCDQSANTSQLFNDYTLSSNIDSSLRVTTPDLMDDILEDPEVTLSLPSPPCQTSMDHAMPPGDQIDATGLPSSRRNSKSPFDPALPLMNPLPTVKLQRGRSQKTPIAPKAPHALSTKDMFNFNSSSNLTYDSFWSSHTGHTTPQSRRGSHIDGIVDYTPTFQTSGIDFNDRTATINRPLNNPASTPHDIASQPNPDLQRDFGVPA